MEKSTTVKPKIIQLPKIVDKRGNLSFVESGLHLPFEIKRAYWIYDVPGGETRGGHAFKEQHEFIVAMSGSFDVVVENREGYKRKFSLNRSYMGLYVPSGSWRQMKNFSTNSIALVLASTYFDHGDYIRNYDLFKDSSYPTTHNSTITRSDFVSPNIDLFNSSVSDCAIQVFDINHREKGNITVIENGKDIPFDINRVYYLYDVPGGEERGGHAHKKLYQLLIAAGGSFDVIMHDGTQEKVVTLNRPYQALRIVPGIWRELKNFSSGSCCLVIASHHYNESDYIRDFNDFLKIKNK